MGTMEINQIQKSMQYATPVSAVKEAEKSGAQSETDSREINSKPDKSEKRNTNISQEVYGNVLDISEDGDTVSARPESMQALDDGMVILKEDTANQETSDSNRYNSLNGYSEKQVETLYRQGKISHSDYKKEMDRRARLEEATGEKKDDNPTNQTESDSDTAKELGQVSALGKKNDIENDALLTALKNGRTDLMLDVFQKDTAQ